MKIILQHETEAEMMYMWTMSVYGYTSFIAATWRPKSGWSVLNLLNDDEFDLLHNSSLFSEKEMSAALESNMIEYSEGEASDRWGSNIGQEDCRVIEKKWLESVVSDVDIFNWILKNREIQYSLLSSILNYWNVEKSKPVNTDNVSLTIIDI